MPTARHPGQHCTEAAPAVPCRNAQVMLLVHMLPAKLPPLLSSSTLLHQHTTRSSTERLIHAAALQASCKAMYRYTVRVCCPANTHKQVLPCRKQFPANKRGRGRKQASTHTHTPRSKWCYAARLCCCCCNVPTPHASTRNSSSFTAEPTLLK
jgi:hypothetical protein